VAERIAVTAGTAGRFAFLYPQVSLAGPNCTKREEWKSGSSLLEKTRSVTTDNHGEYKIIDLRPGTYSVTFALPLFATARKQGIELVSDLIATVDATSNWKAQKRNIIKPRS
jgi:hypothetical protein